MSNETIVKTVLNFYPEVQAIYLFGTYGTQDEHKDSDVDVAILFPHDKAKTVSNLAMSECWFAIEGVLKKTADLINMRMVNTVFQNEIIQEGRLIYKQNEYSVDEFEMNVMSSYQKLNEERADILEDILETGRILR